VHAGKRGSGDAPPFFMRKGLGRFFFFAKKKQKTLAHLACALGKLLRLMSESFLVLFCKKELLAFYS
jgi:hypothetical protein